MVIFQVKKLQKISKFLHPCNLSWIFSLMSSLVILLKLHLDFQVWTWLTTQLVISIVHVSSMFCCLYPLNQTQVLWSLKTHCLWCVCCYLIIPMGICILHYAHGGESMDTGMGVEHFFIHCLWCQISCGLWTKAPIYFIQFKFHVVNKSTHIFHPI